MKASLEQILGRLQAVLKALHLAVWLVLIEYVLLAISRPLELPLAIAATLAGIAAVVGLLGRFGAMRWEPARQSQRALFVGNTLEVFTLLGAVAFALMPLRPDLPEDADLRLLQWMALMQFVSGLMLVPFLARTTGRLGVLHLRPLLAAIIYWAEFVALAALVCWVVSFFSRWDFLTLFGHTGPVVAVGFQLAQRNVLIELMRLVELGEAAAAAQAASDGFEAAEHSDTSPTDGHRNGKAPHEGVPPSAVQPLDAPEGETGANG